MILKKLETDFAVCKVQSLEQVQWDQEFTFFSKTDDELSLVCPVAMLPENTIDVEYGWRGLKILGVLDFGMVGVIARIAGLLAEASISIFVISTYNTDYIFLKEKQFDSAIRILGKNAYTIE